MNTMKRAACAALLTGAAFAAHAQSAPQPLTRAQVRQELAELHAVGYRASLASSPDFPQNMQAIMQRAAQARGHGDPGGYGGNGRAAVESGKPALPPAIDRDTYAHH